MNNWAFAATIFLLSASILTPRAHAEPTMTPKNPRNVPFEGTGGRDISESAWQSWQAPVGTIDPERLIPGESTNSTANAASASYHFDSFKSDSFQFGNTVKDGKPIQVEEPKLSEKIESGTDSPSQTTAVLATPVPKPKSDSKRILMIAIVSVAVLGYRKFRRANTSPHPPKPNFL